MNQKISIADRTKALAIRIVKACTFLDEKPGVCRILSKQLLRSGTPIQFAIINSQFAIRNYYLTTTATQKVGDFDSNIPLFSFKS
ncbi:hypothetical protein [uncultured Nostoc sp.]|uniref:hypothetical protein n=1 Tax=uncultured Nostoc sp. TaxID=340711 RepID=UPI0035CA1DDC